MTDTRANRREVRNPVLALPAAQRILEADQSVRQLLRSILLDIRDDARQRAAECWRRHKAPMAVYWKAVSVYANHIARVMK
jgi:hypothetical protein